MLWNPQPPLTRPRSRRRGSPSFQRLRAAALPGWPCCLTVWPLLLVHRNWPVPSVGSPSGVERCGTCPERRAEPRPLQHCSTVCRVSPGRGTVSPAGRWAVRGNWTADRLGTPVLPGHGCQVLLSAHNICRPLPHLPSPSPPPRPATKYGYLRFYWLPCTTCICTDEVF